MIPAFWGALELIEVKTKIKLLSLRFFFLAASLNELDPLNTALDRPLSAEFPGGGAAQNIKAVPLDRLPVSPWWFSLLDGVF